MPKRFYLKEEVSGDDEPPIELEASTDERVEDVIETGVSYWGLGDRGDYKAMKEGDDLDPTRKISDVDINDGDTIWLIEKDEDEKARYTQQSQQQSRSERQDGPQKTEVYTSEKGRGDGISKKAGRSQQESTQQQTYKSTRRKKTESKKEKQDTTKKGFTDPLLDQDVVRKVKEWIDKEIGVPKNKLTVVDREIVKGGKRIYKLEGPKHEFEVSVKGGKIENYRPLT